MKKSIAFLFLFFILVLKLGLAFGSFAFLISGIVIFLISNRVEYLQKISMYAKRYENIYVISNHPDTDQAIYIEEVDHLTVNASYKEVLKEVKRQEAILSESKNPFFCDPTLKDHQRLQVIPIIYQDGEFVNESFKAFRKRVVDQIKKDRAERHSILKKADEVWYHKYSNNQRSIEWTKK